MFRLNQSDFIGASHKRNDPLPLQQHRASQAGPTPPGCKNSTDPCHPSCFVFFLLWPSRRVKTSQRPDRRWGGKWIISRINNKFQSCWISVKGSKMWSLSADIEMIEVSISWCVLFPLCSLCLWSGLWRLQLAGRRPVSSSWQRLQNRRSREAASGSQKQQREDLNGRSGRLAAAGKTETSLSPETLQPVVKLSHSCSE